MKNTHKLTEREIKIKALEDRLKAVGRSPSRQKADLLFELAWAIGFDDIEKANTVNEKGRKTAEKMNYEHGLAVARRNLGFLYYAKSDFAMAIKEASDSLTAFEEAKNEIEQARAQNIIGLCYWSLGNFDLTLEYLNKAKNLYEANKNTEDLPWALTSLGGVYENLRDFEKAVSYHNQSLKYFRANNDTTGKARALLGLGTVYLGQNKCKEALRHIKKSLTLFEEIGGQVGVSRAYNDMALAYQSLGRLEKALQFHEKSLEIRRALDNRHIIITSLMNLGKLHNQMKSPKQALELLTEARTVAEKIDAKPKLYQIHQALSETYEALGNLPKALAHLKKFQETKESVFSSATNTKLKNMQIQFEIERSEKEAEIHRLRNIELKQALDDLQTAQGHMLQAEKMAALGRLTAGLAHEINNPIGAIKSSADLMIRGLKKIKTSLGISANGDQRGSVERIFGLLEKNGETTLGAADRIAEIVRSLKNFARLDEAERKKVDIHEGLESTLTLIQHEVHSGVEIKKNYGKLPLITVYPNQLNQVFMTILRNAVQAINAKGQVTISTAKRRGALNIEISDNGRGMSPEELKSLFELNFSRKHARVGVTMGLYNAHNIIKQHNGTIEVESQPGMGTKFAITLPIQ